MEEAAQRGYLLLEQERWELAAREFEAVLAANPEDARAHAHLALCHLQMKNLERATKEAAEAIRSEPSYGYGHYVCSRIWSARGQADRALQEIMVALELSPANPSYHGTAASILAEQESWALVLRHAERGLEIDANHSLCINMRALALLFLGRGEVAIDDLRDRLKEEPENAETLTTLGWALLLRKNRDAALNAFSEALRIDPEMERAREGLLQAVRSKNPIYGLLLGYFFWMRRLSPSERVGVLFGSYYIRTYLGQLKRRYPQLRFLLGPLLFVAGLMSYFTWTGGAFSNLLLSLDRQTRRLLNDEERGQASLTGGIVVMASVSAVMLVLTWTAGWLALMFLSITIMIPLCCSWDCEEGWPRQVMTASTVVLACLGLFSVGRFFWWPRDPLALEVFKIYGQGLFIASIVGNVVKQVKVKK
jgi:tetratricopeptide (TPR) repeat protein